VPFLLSLPSPPTEPPRPITGQLFITDAATLTRLDELEGISRGYYQRVKVSTVGTLEAAGGADADAPADDTDTVDPWLYVRRVDSDEAPKWASFPSVDRYGGSLVDGYVAPADRDPRWATDMFAVLLEHADK
jgi:gamma-glutamylaminecyclotransferase